LPHNATKFTVYDRVAAAAKAMAAAADDDEELLLAAFWPCVLLAQGKVAICCSLLCSRVKNAGMHAHTLSYIPLDSQSNA